MKSLPQNKIQLPPHKNFQTKNKRKALIHQSSVSSTQPDTKIHCQSYALTQEENYKCVRSKRTDKNKVKRIIAVAATSTGIAVVVVLAVVFTNYVPHCGANTTVIKKISVQSIINRTTVCDHYKIII